MPGKRQTSNTDFAILRTFRIERASAGQPGRRSDGPRRLQQRTHGTVRRITVPFSVEWMADLFGLSPLIGDGLGDLGQFLIGRFLFLLVLLQEFNDFLLAHLFGPRSQ